MTDEFDRDPVADALRESLAEQARRAPRGDMLAEQIIYAAERPAGQRRQSRRGWRSWTLPLVTAGAVAGVVAAVVGITSIRPTATAPPATQSSSVIHSGTPTGTVSTTSSPTTNSTAPVVSPAGLTDVKVLDLTFDNLDEGWALASADCINGPGICTALVHTTDGTHWKSAGHTPFDVPGITGGCADPCVTGIRFATSSVGYVFGPSAFFMTTDGGASWHQQDGGAILLESLNDNVIRVTSTGTGCPSWCNVAVKTSAVGSTIWTPASLPNSANLGHGVQLVRGNNRDAYLLFTGHVAGGGRNATSHLVRSTDNGSTWTSAGEPCPQNGGEVDSHAIAAGNGDTVTVLCATRQAPQRWFVATSADAGATFAPRSGTVPAATADLLTGDPSTVLVTGGDGISISTDGGQTWQQGEDVTGRVTFLGFESTQVGRVVTDHNTIWTTRDGGATWHQGSVS